MATENVHESVTVTLRAETTYLVMIVAGAIFCLCPLFDLFYRTLYSNDESTFISLVNEKTTSQATFFVILIPAVDLLLDFPALVKSHFIKPETSVKRTVEPSVVVRLTNMERLLFIMGVAVRSLVFLIPYTADDITTFIVATCINNCSILLTIGPLLIFLQRCTTAFTTTRTFIIIFTGLMGVSMFASSYYYRSDKLNCQDTILAAHIFFGICGGVSFLTVMISVFRYYMDKLSTQALRIAFINSLICPVTGKRLFAIDRITESCECEIYSTLIPAIHMIFIIVIVSTNISVRLRQMHAQYLYDRRIYIILAAEIMILVIELRIRKNEIAKGLVS